MSQPESLVPGMSKDDVAEGPGQITSAMLTEALRTAMTVPDARVTGVRWERIGQDFGFTGLIALRGCPHEDVEAVLAAIAPVHAAWWSQPDRLVVLPNWTGDRAANERRQDRYREHWTTLAERGVGLDPRLRRMATRLGDGLADVLDRLNAAPQTVVHADLHLDNVLFPRTRSVA